MAHHLKCPFCPATPSVGYFYKHLITQHITSLFDETTDWGKENLKWLNAKKVRTTPYSINLPKNESKYCCPSCCVAFNKIFYAKNHQNCYEKSADTLEEYRVCLKITPKEAPFASELKAENGATSEDVEKYLYREKVYQKIIYNLVCEVEDKQEWTWWFNKLCDDSQIYEKYKEMKEEGTAFPDDDRYNINLECHREMKLLGLTYEQIKATGMKKLPTPPS